MSPILGIIDSQKSGHLFTYDFESIATVTLSSASVGITFNSIPSTYKHLQIRGVARSNRVAQTDDIHIRFNGDTGANYALNQTYTDGNTQYVYTLANTNNGGAFFYPPSANSGNSNTFGLGIADIIDYANTNKYKTVKAMGGAPTNDSSASWLLQTSGLWLSTSAINSVTVFSQTGSTLVAGSTFALYGIKG